MTQDYVPDRLYARLFRPWTLPESEWPLCREDWARVNAIAALPWKGRILDIGSGDGTLGAMVMSKNPSVSRLRGVEIDKNQCKRAYDLWPDHGVNGRSDWDSTWPDDRFDGALCCEVLEHITPEDGAEMLRQIYQRLVHGGLLCVTTPYRHGPRAEYPGHRVLLPDEMEIMVASAGFSGGYSTMLPDYKRPIWRMEAARKWEQ